MRKEMVFPCKFLQANINTSLSNQLIKLVILEAHCIGMACCLQQNVGM